MKIGALKRLLLVVLVIGVVGCDNLTKKSEKALPLLETPPSYLSFRVNFPISELQQGINRVLPKKLFDDALPMKDQKDTLFLSVIKKGNIQLSYKNGEMLAKIPLKINAAVKKSVLGITFSNQDTPVEFTGILEASANIGITDDWNLSVTCRYNNFELGDQATFSVMGITFNAEKTINTALDNRRDQLSNIICAAINASIDFRQVIQGIWIDLQSPISIVRDPGQLWLYTDPIALNGELIPMDDIMALHMEFRTHIQIRSDKAMVKPKPLGVRKPPLNQENKLLTYPDVRISYKDLSQVLSQNFKGQAFNYEGYEVKVEEVIVYQHGQNLALNLKVSGDIEGSIKVTGKPILTADYQMRLSEFKFEIQSDDGLLNIADWAIHTLLEEYLSEQLQLETKSFFDGLDNLIMTGISKEVSASKIGVDFHIDNISTYQTRMTDSSIQWIFAVEGSAGLTLRNGLFKGTR